MGVSAKKQGAGIDFAGNMKEGYNHMEFIVKTDLNSLPKTIDFNFEEMKSELKEKLAYYNALVVTADSIKDAKDDKAKLNKLFKAVEDKRKDVKKACLAPYEQFEKQCKEITAMIQEPILAIDAQVKVFDEIEQNQKWEQIEAYYKADVKELKDLVPLEKIVSSKWKNKTESLESVNNAIGDTLERIRGELETISTLHSPYEQQIKDVYLNDFNLSKALMEQKRLEERQKQIEEMERQKEERRKQAEEAERKRQEEQQRAAQNVSEPVIEAKKESPVQAVTEDTPATPTAPITPKYSATFKVTGTQTQLQALAAFMKKYNIKYEVI